MRRNGRNIKEMQQIERTSGNHATAPTIQIPAEIHARVKAYRDKNFDKEAIKRGLRRPALAELFVHFAWLGINEIYRGEKPIFIERGVQPKTAFIGCKIAYPPGLPEIMQEILTRIKEGEFQSRPKAPKTVVSMRCIFIMLVELGINGAVS